MSELNQQPTVPLLAKQMEVHEDLMSGHWYGQKVSKAGHDHKEIALHFGTQKELKTALVSRIGELTSDLPPERIDEMEQICLLGQYSSKDFLNPSFCELLKNPTALNSLMLTSICRNLSFNVIDLLVDSAKNRTKLIAIPEEFLLAILDYLDG